MEPDRGGVRRMGLRRLGGEGIPGESLIGTRECGSYAARACTVAALLSLACLARRRFGFSGPTKRIRKRPPLRFTRESMLSEVRIVVHHRAGVREILIARRRVHR